MQKLYVFWNAVTCGPISLTCNKLVVFLMLLYNLSPCHSILSSESLDHLDTGTIELYNAAITQFGTHRQPTEFGLKTDASSWSKEPLTTCSMGSDLLCAIFKLHCICHGSSFVSNGVHNDK